MREMVALCILPESPAARVDADDLEHFDFFHVTIQFVK